MADASFSNFVGRSETKWDCIDLARARALQATLCGEHHVIESGTELPPLWHWIYFWDAAPLSQLGVDGHPKRGGFLPAITLPRRMWAGSRVFFHAPVPIGAQAERRSTILRIDNKTGRSGALVFVTVRHEILINGGMAVSEEQDIVFRDHPTNGDAMPESGVQNERAADWSRTLDATPPLLFRYSALTMNAHRIHYDLPYATEAEHYAGLIVHGPLAATMLADLAAADVPHTIAEFSFRGVSPIVAGKSHKLCGALTDDGAGLWIMDSAGRTCMTAKARWTEATQTT